jgi:hypothetical protein
MLVYHQRKKKKNTIFILIKLNVDNIHSTNFSLLEHEKYIAQDGKNCQRHPAIKWPIRRAFQNSDVFKQLHNQYNLLPLFDWIKHEWKGT